MGTFLKRQVKDILFVTVGYTLGGSERMISLIAPRLKTRGYKVRVLAFKGWGPISEKLKISGVDCFALFGKGKFDSRVLWRYFLYLRKNPPDLIIAFLYRAYIPTRIFGSLLGIPNISSIQGVWGWANPLHKFLEKITAPLCYVTYSCSEAVTDFLVRDVGIKRKKLVTIPNGIDIKAFPVKINKKKKMLELGLNPFSRVVGTVSRLHEPTKGIKILLEAFTMLQKNLDSQLIIVGSGKDEKMLKNLARDMKIQVYFLGERIDIAEILQVMDVFVLTSFYEGLPVSVLEAMACGTPVVATDVGGVKEVISDGTNGLLVEPGNPHAIAEKIKKLLKDENLRKDFGKAGFKMVKEKFSIDKTVQGIENLCKGVLP
jgi:glycosyltransferase involved in cell wall biosynthesis